MTVSLTELIHNEFGQMLYNSSLKVIALTKFAYETTPEHKDTTRNELVKINSKIKIAIEEYQKNFEKEVGFTAETFSSLKAAYKRLGQALPDETAIERINENIMGGLNRTFEAKLYKQVRKSLKFSTTIAALSTACALYIQAFLPAAIHGSAAVSGFVETKSKKESDLRTSWTNLGVIIGTYVANKLMPKEVSDGELVAYVSMFLLQLPALLLEGRHAQYLLQKAKYSSKTKKLKRARIDYDRFVINGIAIKEASNNLTYVDRVCKAESRPIEDFQSQIDSLESVLTKYINGKATFEEVINARIKYVPKSLEEKTKQIILSDNNQPIQKKKKGYTAEQYLEIRKEREELNKHKRSAPGKVNLQEEIEQEEYESRTEAHFSLSEELQKKYHSKERISSYLFSTLVDLSMQKIGTTHQGELIREAQSGQFLVNKMREKYNLPVNAVIYKMQPIGALRTIYTKSNGDVKILEILTHSQYEDLMKNR
ncbi:MAG: hypothetical protein ACP5N3_02795 [Candidatus Nanoarchaeia archaeon]